MAKVTDPELLRLLNAGVSPQPTLQERKGEVDITQGEASAENAGANARETNTLLPAKVRKLDAEARTAENAAATSDEKKQDRANARSMAASALAGVLDKIDRVALDAADNGGLFETGATGELMRDLPGWATFGADRPAKSLASTLKSIDANSAVTALTNMRKESPTGAAVGNATNEDMVLMKSLVANLDPNADLPTFMTGLADTKRHYLKLLGQLDPDAAASYAKRAGIRFDEDGTAVLSPINGEDDRKRLDPFGIIGPGSYGPNMGGSADGSGGGGGQPPAPDGGGWDYKPYLEALKQGAGSVVKGALGIPGMIVNPLMNTAYSALGYEPNYDMGTVAREALGLPKNQDSTADTIIEFGSGSLGGGAAFRGLSKLAQPGTWKEVSKLMGAQPIRDALAGVGGGAASETVKSQGGGPIAQTGAALLGGGLTYGGANAVSHAMTPKAPTEFANLAKRYNVDFLPTDTGSDVAKLVTNAGTASPLSVGSITAGAKHAQQTLGSAAQRVAAEASANGIATSDEAGEFLRSAAKRYAENTRDIGNTNYEQAWKAAGPLEIPARNADAVILEQIRTLRKQPERNANQIAELQQLRRDLARGQDAKSLHALRSDLRQGVFDGKLRSGTEQSRMKAIGAALGNDLTGYLDSVGLKGAANKVRKADAYWQQRVEQIDQVLQPIIGKDNGSIGGEQIVSRIESMARGQFGGNKRLSRLMVNMTEPERQQVRSTVIDRMGRTRADDMVNADAGETPFSASHFLANWEKMTPQGKATLFGDGDMRKHIDDIAKLAKGMTNSERIAKSKGGMRGAFGNSSTALQAGWAMAHFPSWLAGAGAQYLTGKLMASPAFARHLARAPAVKDPRTWVQQIGTMAAREPALKNDLMNFQQGFMQSLEASPAPRVYADEEDKDVGREPVGNR